MNYIEALSENERYVISVIVNTWKEKSISDSDKYISVSDKLGIHLYELLNHLIQTNSISTKCIAPQIDQEGGEILLNHFFETQYIEEIFGKDYKKKLKEVVAQQIQTLIMVTSFISKLYQDGLIYFPDENFENSKYEEWAVPLNEYPKPIFIREISKICSKKIAKFLDSFLQSTICPSFQLIDLYEHEFKTIENRRYEEQLNISTDSLRIAESSLNEAKNATALARKSQRNSIWASLVICCLSLLGSYWISSTVPASIENEFSIFLDSHLRLIENNDSVIIQLNKQLNELVISRKNIE